MTTQKTKFLGSLIALGGLAALGPGTTLAAKPKAQMTAEEHAELATKGDDLATVHRHLHHVLNCLVGEKGEGFDASAGNPCAATGAAIPQTSDAKMKMMLEKAAKTARMGIADDSYEAAKKAAMEVETDLK